MTITTGPDRARTDLAGDAATGAARAAPVAAAGVRRLGLALTAGAAIWAGGLLAVGANPASSVGVAVSDLTAVPFQLGVFALLTAQLRTRATGLSTSAVALLKVEYVLLGIATVWSVLHGLVPAWRDDLWLAVMDVCWPLSMLGMFVIGVKLAFAGRWRGVARVWPLVAESWAVVTVPSMVLFGQGVADIVGPVHLLFGYGVLGLILARRPELTGARPR